jgi:hypothetical protein
MTITTAMDPYLNMRDLNAPTAAYGKGIRKTSKHIIKYIYSYNIILKLL